MRPPKTGAAKTAASPSPKLRLAARDVKSRSVHSPSADATVFATTFVLPPGEKYTAETLLISMFNPPKIIWQHFNTPMRLIQARCKHYSDVLE